MTEARKEIEDMLIYYITKITGSNSNAKLYREAVLDKMSDVQFDKFMDDLEHDRVTLSIIAPIGGDTNITVENNMKIAKDLGYDFFQRLIFSESEILPAYKNDIKSFVTLMPIRRASQLLTKKISIPKTHTHVDTLTGQVTGESRASKLTNPELQILIAQGFKDSVIELMKTRGGDEGQAIAYVNTLFKNGEVSQAELEQYSTGVVSSKVLTSYFQGMHIKANVIKK